jgi:Fur family ferric uptake transcriptional regulator
MHQAQARTAALRRNGLRVTPGRLAVLEVLEGLKEPASAGEIADMMGKGSVDRVTVYRTLEAFVAGGLAREVHLRHGHVDYESTQTSDHHHLVCSSCGYSEDFEGCEVDDLVKATLKKHPRFARVDDHSFELFGRCTRCARRGK